MIFPSITGAVEATFEKARQLTLDRPSGALPPVNGRPQYALRMAQDWDRWEASLPDDKKQIVKQAQSAYPDAPSARMAMFNDQFLLEQTPGVPSRTVLSNREIYMAGIAKQQGWDGAESDPAIFNAKAKEHLTKAYDERVMAGGHSDTDPVTVVERMQSRADSLLVSGYEAGLKFDPGDEQSSADSDAVTAFTKWNEPARGKPGFRPENAAKYWETFSEQFQRGLEDKKIAVAAAKEIYPIVQSSADIGGADITKALPALRGLTDQQLALALDYLGTIKGRSEGQGTAEFLTKGEVTPEFMKEHPEQAMKMLTAQAMGGNAPFIAGNRVQRRLWQSALAGWAERDDIRHFEYKPGSLMMGDDYQQLLSDMKAAGIETTPGVSAMGEAYDPEKPGRHKIALTEDQAAFHAKRREAYEKDKETIEKLRDIAGGKLDPLDRNTIWQKASLGLGEAIPLIAYTIAPGGVGIRYTAYTYDSKNKLIQQGVPRADAENISPFIGGAQAVLDTATLAYLTKVPFVDKMMKSITNSAARFLLHTGGTIASQTAILTARNHLTEALAVDAYAALTDNIPGTDWSRVKEEIKHATPDTIYSMLLLAPIGAGMAHFKDIKGPDLAVRDPGALRLMQFNDDAIARVVDAPRGKAPEIFKEEWDKRKFDGSQSTVATPAAEMTRTELRVPDEEQSLNDEAGVKQFFHDNQGWHIQHENGTITDTGDAHTGTVIRERMADQNLDATITGRLREQEDAARAAARDANLPEAPEAAPPAEAAKPAEASAPPALEDPADPKPSAPAATAVPVKPEEVAPSFNPSGGQRPVKEKPAKAKSAKAKTKGDAVAVEKSRFGVEYDALEAELAALPKVGGKSLLDEVRRLRAEGVEKFGGKAGRIVKRMQAIEREADGVHSWTSATEESVAESADAIVERADKADASKAAAKELEEIVYHSGFAWPKAKNRTMSQLDKATVERGGKLQKSSDEARRAEREIRKAVPDKDRQGMISVWMEAAGDKTVLHLWEKSAKQPWMKALAKGAQSLTPAEIAIAQKARAAYDILGKRGQKHDVLKGFRDNYVTHVWADDPAVKAMSGTKTLKEKLQFSKQRTFSTFFEGDQAGFVPKQTAIGNLLAGYIIEMNRVIADRQFVKDLSTRKGSDGRPLVIPRGIMETIEAGEDGAGGQIHLVMPKGRKGVKDGEGEPLDQTGYKSMDEQPALSDWRWIGKDEADNPIMLKADLLLHPEAWTRVHAMMGKSWLREWSNSGGKAAPLKALVKFADKAQSEMKAMMFSGLSPFHAVQEATHSIGHRINPFFNVPKIDLRDRGQARAASLGLKLVHDRTTATTYIEGVGSHSPWLFEVGKKYGGAAGRFVAGVNEHFQQWLFERYIPGLKYKTFEAMETRNRELYKEELAKGELTLDDIGILSAEQSNAAYGHLNYDLLDRNPTMQHFMQLGLLAPDFLEARARFVGQAFKGIGSKNGKEQLHAIAFLAAAQIGAAFVLGNTIGDGWDWRHPFEVIRGGRRYFMRSVPEDIFALMKDTRQFLYGRVNPVLIKGWQALSGLNYRGEKVTGMQTLGELAAGYIPMTLRYAPGLKDLTESTKNSPTTPLEQLWGSMGLRISRYSPIAETYKQAKKWMEEVKKIDTDSGSYPVSKYQQLRYALEDGDMERAAEHYTELLKEAKPKEIREGFESSLNHPFTESKAMDKEFAGSLPDYERGLFELAVQKRKDIWARFLGMRGK